MKSVWLSTLLVATAVLAWAAAAPVEFTFLGFDATQKTMRYQVKILTHKPVSQVDFNLRCFNGNGKILYDRPVSWRNMIRGAPQPIEAGKTYTVEDSFSMEGAVRGEGKLLRVVYTDGTGWTPADLSF
jgi:hypothetical protein